MAIEQCTNCPGVTCTPTHTDGWRIASALGTKNYAVVQQTIEECPRRTSPQAESMMGGEIHPDDAARLLALIIGAAAIVASEKQPHQQI